MKKRQIYQVPRIESYTRVHNDFNAWASLLHYKLMILRCGLAITLYVDEFKAWAPLLQYKLMSLRQGLPFYKLMVSSRRPTILQHKLMSLRDPPFTV